MHRLCPILKPEHIKGGSQRLVYPANFLLRCYGRPPVYVWRTFKRTQPWCTSSPPGIGGALSMLTQVRINVTNIYSSSLSLSNFFENVLNFKPGRRFWVVVAGVTAMILMLGGITDHLDNALTFQGVFLMSWAAILVTDFLVVKKAMKIGPGYYEERQEHLYKWNPVGVWSLLSQIF